MIADEHRLPIADRPRFAAQMIAVWRWHHLRKGEDLSVTIHPGEWPEGVPMEVKGCEVVEHEVGGGPGGVLVLGRVGEVWKAAYTMALAWPGGPMSVQELATTSFYMEVDGSADIKLWMAPNPATGEVPAWLVPVDRRRKS